MSTSEMIQVIETLPPDAQSLVFDFVQLVQRRYAQSDAPPVRDERLRRFAGAIHMGTGLDNEAIDADLAREFANEVK